MGPEPDDGGLKARLRRRGTDAAHAAHAWIERRKQTNAPLGIAVHLLERDRDAFGSVLGSAIALRLFLFVVALLVVIVSALNLVLSSSGVEDAIAAVGVAGQMAAEVEEAARASTGRDIGLLLTGLFLCLTAGRSLTRVLAACSAGASGLDARSAKFTMRVAARVTALISLLIVAAALLNRVRGSYGFAIAAGSLAANAVVLGGSWFFVCLSLPRATRDPGAALPGAVTFGVAITAVQWFMHYYLPHKIASASEVMGMLGVTVASLSYLFIIGRTMAATLVINAVLFERLGSISELVFALPVIRRVPVRFPRVARFFDLQAKQDASEGDPPASPADP